MNIKHTILMITYNQEDYIRETLDCLFRQGVLPHEVIVADDCSVDSTRDIILKFQKKYPEIIKPIFHEKNLGINQNLNYIIDNVKVSGDVISFLAGDDLYKDNMLLAFNDCIKNNGLNPQNEQFLIMSNQLSLDANGIEKVSLNNFVLQNKNYLKLKLRNSIGNRYTGISRALFNTMGHWNLDLGLWADALHSLDLYTNCEKFYFINKSFPVYRHGSGVTSKEKQEIFSKSWIQVANFMLENRAKHLDIWDKLYLQKTIAIARMELENTLSNRIKFIALNVLNIADVFAGYGTLKKYVYSYGVLLSKTQKIMLKKIMLKKIIGVKK